ncbi:hypothetical protein CEY16_06685 [Halalkalibacillus sediminis]|uniref:Uncharacterized protein n=1 Tax=Halalkalibacillus sediminis TaxID=2018042 RepID=A0A2I0QTE8_9BACI|nr:hypothetical protein [Halalkalibacillus sediminis]PKR77617.1 hypothetical protein CEY16_06685 [Halalkalibacillus sediminis]
MFWYATIGIIVCVIALVITLSLGGKSDEGYYKSTKRNVTNLSLIYIVTIIGAFIALGLFIYLL